MPSATMTITFFKSFICPRCHYVGKILAKIQNDEPNLIIEKIDVTTKPLFAWQAGVRMIPALRINKRTLSGLFLTKKMIRNFIDEERLK